jgi:hypothetical protein
VGAIATVLVLFLKFIGIDVDAGVVTEFIVNIMGAGAFIMWLYGQFRRDDLIWGLWRKEPKE